MAYQNPSVEDFKAYFSRDFPYSSDPSEGVTDTDIAKAYQLTNTMINQRLFTSQSNYTLGYLYLSAHNLVLSIQESSQGLAGGGSANWLEQSKSVGNVSQSFAIPQNILNNPMFAMYTKTTYGMRYFQMVYPYLIGPNFIAFGRTNP